MKKKKITLRITGEASSTEETMIKIYIFFNLESYFNLRVSSFWSSYISFRGLPPLNPLAGDIFIKVGTVWLFSY